MSIFVARSASVAARVLDGEMIVMSTKDSTLFTLSDVATEIWQAADGVTPLEDIVRDKVCTKFQVELPTALADAEAFCRGLAEHGILLVSDKPIEASAAPCNT